MYGRYHRGVAQDGGIEERAGVRLEAMSDFHVVYMV